MSIQIKSILEQIASEVFIMTDITKIKTFVVDFVEQHKRMNDIDRQSIIKNINECKSVYKAHYYISNALLKYEGLSLNGHTKKEIATADMV